MVQVKTDLGGSDLRLLGSQQHERAHDQMGQQKRIELLNDSFWGQTAQGSCRQMQMGARLVNDHQRRASARDTTRPPLWLGTGKDPTRWSPGDRPVPRLLECVGKSKV